MLENVYVFHAVRDRADNKGDEVAAYVTTPSLYTKQGMEGAFTVTSDEKLAHYVADVINNYVTVTNPQNFKTARGPGRLEVEFKQDKTIYSLWASGFHLTETSDEDKAETILQIFNNYINYINSMHKPVPQTYVHKVDNTYLVLSNTLLATEDRCAAINFSTAVNNYTELVAKDNNFEWVVMYKYREDDISVRYCLCRPRDYVRRGYGVSVLDGPSTDHDAIKNTMNLLNEHISKTYRTTDELYELSDRELDESLYDD